MGINLGVHRVHFGEETVGVISQLIGIGQDLLHRDATGSNVFEDIVLLDQSIFKHRGILIQNAGGLKAEVINDGGGCFA